MIINAQDLMYVKKLKTIADIAKDKRPITQTRKVYNETKKKLPLHEDKSIKAA